jgi:hypothetical protein
LQRGAKVVSLFGAQGGELKSVLCTEGPDNLRRNDLFVAAWQGDLEDDGFSDDQGLGYKGAQAAFTEISHPALQA